MPGAIELACRRCGLGRASCACPGERTIPPEVERELRLRDAALEQSKGSW